MSNVELAKVLGVTEEDIRDLLSPRWDLCLRCETPIRWTTNLWVDADESDTCPDGFAHQG